MKPHSKEYIDHLTNIDVFDKLRIYNHYLATEMSLKHNSEVRVTVPKFANRFFDSMEEMKSLSDYKVEFIRHWEDLKPVSFNDWSSIDNVKHSNHGDDWEAKGWAQQVTTQLSGMYNYYWRFKDEISI